LFKLHNWQGMGAHACNLALRRLRQVNSEFEANLGSKVRFCLNKQQKQIQIQEKTISYTINYK
jgi:hypothetical protein